MSAAEWSKIDAMLESWNADNGRVPFKRHRLELKGPVPSKKNLNMRRANGSIGINDKAAKAAIDSLILQARIQWGPKPPLAHPRMGITFHVTSGRQDRDNQLSCIMDVLVSAGVLANDSAASCNGPILIHPARLTEGDPFTVIVIEEILL